MNAFALEEGGEYERAEQAAQAALEANPLDARAHHVMAHVFEMTDRADAGARWMEQHVLAWGGESVVTTHCWWHLALFHIAQGQRERALSRAQLQPTRHGATTRLLGLPACRALMEFGRGNDAQAIELFARLPALAHRLGGSHAQRDVLHLTALRAIERIRRPAQRHRGLHAGTLQALASTQTQ